MNSSDILPAGATGILKSNPMIVFDFDKCVKKSCESLPILKPIVTGIVNLSRKDTGSIQCGQDFSVLALHQKRNSSATFSRRGGRSTFSTGPENTLRQIQKFQDNKLRKR